MSLIVAALLGGCGVAADGTNVAALESCVTVCNPVCTGDVCTQECRRVCGATPCGTNFCEAGEYCCNPSCGVCAPLGGACTRQFCPPSIPAPLQCGSVYCAAGTECCNPSCGLCVPPGGSCTQQVCEDPTATVVAD